MTQLPRNHLYMFDSIVLASPNMITFFQHQLTDKKRNMILLDKKILQDVQQLRLSGDLTKAGTLETWVKALLGFDHVKIVDTKEFSSTSEIETILKDYTYDSCSFLMGSMAHAHLFIEHKDVLPQSVVGTIKDGGVIGPWKENTQLSGEAFSIENDHYLLNDYDSQKIHVVYSPRFGYLKLDTAQKIPGGEAVIYPTYQNLMVKIYKKGKLHYVDFKKLQYMVEHRLYNRHVVWPKDLLFYDHQPIGYVMEQIEGMTTLHDLSIERYKEYNLLDRTRVALNFLKVVQYLHDHGYLIGDLKPDNILVGPPQNPEVYIIDTGSFQILDYPCPVMQPEYTKRLWTKDMLKKTLRTLEDEYFPINAIVFHLLMQVNPYYSDDNVDLPFTIDGRKFKFDLKEPTKEPKYGYLKIWYFLPKAIRESLYYYFASDRPTELSEWISELENFIKGMQENIKTGGNKNDKSI